MLSSLVILAAAILAVALYSTIASLRVNIAAARQTGLYYIVVRTYSKREPAPAPARAGAGTRVQN
jgi:hypothetical protein